MHVPATNVMEMFSQLEALDFANAPGMRFMGSLRKQLIANQFEVVDAEKLILRMKISISANAFDDDQMQEVAEKYASIILKLRTGFQAQGFSDPLEAVIAMATALCIEV